VWDLDGAGSSNIEGFATDISTDVGDRVDFKINTNSSNYRIEIYRLGYYGGTGARLRSHVGPIAGVQQPTCPTDGTTGRIEKGYRAYGTELESEYNVAEAGMTRPKVKEHDFVGKDAYLRHREEEPAAIMSTLTVDDPTSSSGVKRYMMGREPVLTADGERIVDRKGRPSYVTSAGSGPSVGKHVLMAYLPPEHAVEGKQLLVQYMGERYPVTVAVAGSTPLFDPENTRVRS